ncbi:DUF7149 domain-containing protein [Thermoflexibacter ruber]|uniref:site-specific DNA-methyltransferase (adenine-specific) n=1 Tax=Thermoflexibacter ruber TaxID=1003 RepID=A0A1I2GNF6_9BACT|nr:TaqI-like C-terminal specificity domain-containing protein [Thermoflexibacter ruber]SFF19494.1 Type II restriction/modification system, DNA methylase subunit YeeA [Thermoflexibacter ruber]
MILKELTPRKALNKAFLKLKPSRTEIDNFKTNLITLLERVNDTESEEFHKNLLIDFLKKTYYDPHHFLNTKGRNDLVIHNGSTAKSPVGVIIEAKKPSNKVEMLTRDNINKKAFQELILYYLRERVTHKNLEIKHLAATNIYEWFIFDAMLLDRLFAQNKNLVKLFNDFEAGRLADTKTDFFYKQVAEPFIGEISAEIEFTYFSFPRVNSGAIDDNDLIPLFKILSPEHLLKLPFANDSNSLDKRFYSELLHIIGLTEIKEGNKKLIERNKAGERHTGTILENAVIQLDSLDKMSRLEKPSQFGKTEQERLFNVALELSITWVNRILFLKLLEAQLITYHKGDASYSFLHSDKIKSYDDLNSLFFQVLARQHDERNEEVKKIFEKVPYLNSSLFEPTDTEQQTIFISNLKDNINIPIFSQTVLKDPQGKKRTGKLNTLQYFLEFLDAYNFGAEGSEEIQEDNKTLINASVLGLIFEKINGYKDGSFFTPGFITMYMCRETIRRAVVQKFKEAGYQLSESLELSRSLTEIYNQIKDIKEANKIVNTLKICDPAAGSGHFLVSALNEIIAIKNDLGILCDFEGRPLKNYWVEVVNDELFITEKETGEEFCYIAPMPRTEKAIKHTFGGDTSNYKASQLPERQVVQQSLFKEKQAIIENCLFGVDINPNSVKICRLRLWIELLKNAYYSPESNFTELETFPNIDINIKCGNSLVSRFAIDADLSKSLRSLKWDIKTYRQLVQSYLHATDKEAKRGFEKLINDIKKDFSIQISNSDPKKTRLSKLAYELYNRFTGMMLFEPEVPYGDNKSDKNLEAKRKEEQGKIEEEMEKLRREIDEIENNKIFENAFEWRFEFPEVLNDDGDFVGFDVVIGNPPYGVSIKEKTEREYLVSNLSKVPDYEIYYWFINKGHHILKQNGIISYIIPNTILFNVFAQSYRLSLFDNWTINEILDCTNFNIFEDATVRNIIFQFIKSDSKKNTLGYKNTANIENFENLISCKTLTISKEIAVSNIQNWGLVFKLDRETLNVVEKIRSEKKPLIELFPETSQGLIAYDKYQGQNAEIIKNRAYHHFSNPNNKFKRWLYGGDITRYSVKWNGKEFIDYCDGIANPREPKYFKGKRLLIREITNPRIFSAITTEELYNDPAIIIVKENPKSYPIECLLGIFNSKLATFYHFNSSPKATKGAFPKILVYDVNNFPLPKTIDKVTQEKIENLVNQILTKKAEDNSNDTADLENQIDQLVYELYGLTEAEIKMIEQS